jgi:succinyldiaminopimelate transaminase
VGGVEVSERAGFVPAPYPYDRLGELLERCNRHDGGVVDCSIGTPCDPTPHAVLRAMAESTATNGYPTSAGSPAYRAAACEMLGRRFGVEVAPEHLAACVGTKEFVASTAHYLALRDPSRDTVLYPAISYPTYAVSAQLAGLRALPVAVEDGRLALESIDAETAARTLVLWANSPSNPTGRLDDLDEIAAFGRRHGIVVCSDECYAEFTWDGPPRTILSTGTEGVLGVHSLSKRSNLAGVRAGFYAGDPVLVAYLRLVRQHAGLIVAGPVQAGAIAAWGDDVHVDEQRARYRRRLEVVRDSLADVGYDVELPQGSFYLWVSRPGVDDGWQVAGELADAAGMLVSPGELFGPTAARHVRVAMVQPDDRLELARSRLAAAISVRGA